MLNNTAGTGGNEVGSPVSLIIYLLTYSLTHRRPTDCINHHHHHYHHHHHCHCQVYYNFDNRRFISDLNGVTKLLVALGTGATTTTTRRHSLSI